MDTNQNTTTTATHTAGPESIPDRQLPWGLVAGYSFGTCSCGWASKTFPTWDEALAACDAHLIEKGQR